MGAAFETRFHPDFLTFPKSLVGFFVDHAREYLEDELDFPSVATVQAMMVLSCHEVGNGSRTRGWLYSGNAWTVYHAKPVAKHFQECPSVSLSIWPST